MHPKEWRISLGMSQAEAATTAFYRGKNPARAWQRWETGQLEPPLSVVHYIEQYSMCCDGPGVWLRDWLEARREWLARK